LDKNPHWYNLLTPWSRVLLEKLTGLQLVKKFPVFYGTRRFITALTRARYLSLFWVSSIQSISPHPTSWRSILILSSHLHLSLHRGSLSLRFPHQNPAHASPHPIRATLWLIQHWGLLGSVQSFLFCLKVPFIFGNTTACFANNTALILVAKSPHNRPPRAYRGSRGIDLLILTLGAIRGWVVSTTPRPLYPLERPGTHCTGGWVGPRAVLDLCEKSRPAGIRSLGRPDRSQSLCRLSYPAQIFVTNRNINQQCSTKPNPVAARSNASFGGCSLAGIVGSNPAWWHGCLLWASCVVRLRSLRWADHSSRGIL
jgi:hypothetical protein